MTDELKRTAAIILAVTDRIENGEAARPSGYWGVGPMESAHALDAMIQNLTPAMLEVVLDRLTGEAK
jgi:hypothetical protein